MGEPVFPERSLTIRLLAGVPLALALGVLVGCPGRHKGESAKPANKPAPKPAAIAQYAGTWKGDATTAVGHANLDGILLQDGNFRCYAQDKVQISGRLELNGTQVTGTGTVLAPKGTTFPNGKASAKVDLVGTVSGNTVELQYKGEDKGKVTLATKTQPSDRAQIKLADLAGSYHSPKALNTSGDEADVRILPTGAFDASDDEVEIKGQVTQIGTDNAFEVQFNHRPLADLTKLTVFKGLAYLLPAQGSSTPPMIAILVSSSDGEHQHAGLFTRTSP